MLPVLAGLMVFAGVSLSVLAAYVSWRRGTAAGLSLAVLLAAVAWWGLAYAVELSVTGLADKTLWGDLKYVGIGALGPAWLVFVLQYTGRAHLVTRRLLLALSVEPIILQVLLASDATHDLVRFYPDSAAGQDLPVVGTGPLFWVHLVYSNALVLVATVLFVRRMVRISRLYWRLSVVLVTAALLPWLANLLHNLAVGPFARIDLTPFAFIATGAVLVWGLLRERLVNLVPVARGLVVESIPDAVLVLDAFRRIVDANPAATQVLGSPRGQLIGRPLVDLLPQQRLLVSDIAHIEASEAQTEITLVVDGLPRYFDARRQPLPDRRGDPAGEVVLLRDITERKQAETRLHDLLAERTRVASTLQASLLPATLPQIPHIDLAGLYQPAGDGREIGGDFFDVFYLGSDTWGLVIGDVSGKGAEAATTTAVVRYTLRTLASSHHAPSRTLQELNARLLDDSTDERYCTLVYALVRPTTRGVQLTICLGGHHPPLLRHHCGTVEPIGRLGTALGLIDDPDLYDSKIDLLPGDLVCLFTDGLVEARRGPDLFGSEGAADVLKKRSTSHPDQTTTALAAAARSHHGTELTDDLALLVLGVIEPHANEKDDHPNNGHHAGTVHPATGISEPGPY